MKGGVFSIEEATAIVEIHRREMDRLATCIKVTEKMIQVYKLSYSVDHTSPIDPILFDLTVELRSIFDELTYHSDIFTIFDTCIEGAKRHTWYICHTRSLEIEINSLKDH